jgi:hypothetical protein
MPLQDGHRECDGGNAMRSIIHILIATICVFVPTLGWSETATVTSGAKAQIAIHSRFDSQRLPARVVITVLKADDRFNAEVTYTVTVK